MVKMKVLNRIAQVEALANQPNKKPQLDALVAKMQQDPISKALLWITFEFDQNNRVISRSSGDMQIQKMQQLANAIKQLGDAASASMVDPLIAKANELAEQFKPQRGASPKEIDLSKLTENAELLMVNVLLRNQQHFVENDKALLATFKSHPKIQESLLGEEKPVTKNSIGTLLSEQEIDTHLRDLTTKEVSETVQSVGRAAAQILSKKEALPLAELKKLKVELLSTIRDQFATELMQSLSTTTPKSLPTWVKEEQPVDAPNQNSPLRK